MKKVVLILLAAVAMAMAKSYPYTHDGFFLNISLGFGGQGMGMTGSSMMDGYKITADGDAEYKYAITCTLEKGLRENTYISR